MKVCFIASSSCGEYNLLSKTCFFFLVRMRGLINFWEVLDETLSFVIDLQMSLIESTILYWS